MTRARAPRQTNGGDRERAGEGERRDRLAQEEGGEARVTKVWRSWTWLTRAMPPIASPAFQAKKPRNMEKNAA
jgi:hypothetical protein